MTQQSPHAAETYTHGYSPTVVGRMAGRTAAQQAAFLLPRLRPGMRLLDVGCGPGTITVGLAEAVAPGEAVGLDVAPAMVEQARGLAAERGVATVRFEVGRGEALPFPDAGFDAAFESTVLEHVPDPLAVLRELRRVLVPGGVVGLRDGDWGLAALLAGSPAADEAVALYARLWRHNGGDPELGRRQRGLLRAAGFEPLETTASAALAPGARFAALLGDRLTDPAFAAQVGALGWADRATLDRLVGALRAWGDHPDALRAGVTFQSVGRAA